MSTSARGLTYLLVATIVFLSLWPHAYPVASGVNDKIGHLLAYAVTAFTSCFGWPRRANWPLAAAALVALGAVIETVQPFVGRSGDTADWLADATGVGVGIAAAALCWAAWSSLAARGSRDG